MGSDGLTASFFPLCCCCFQPIKVKWVPQISHTRCPLTVRLQLPYANNTLQSVLFVGLYMHTTNRNVIKKCEKAVLEIKKIPFTIFKMLNL